MKRIRRVLVVIVILFAAALVYGLIIQPIMNILPGASRPQATPEPVITGTPSPGPTAAPSAAPTVAPTQAPTEPITPAPTDPPTLRQGDKSDAVRQLQQQLIRLGYLSGNADGDFGRKTAQAVKDFQVCNGLKEDGVCGPACWSRLLDRYDVVNQKTVYVSKSGIYHTDEHCSGMKTSTKMQLSDAIRKGHQGHHCH